VLGRTTVEEEVGNHHRQQSLENEVEGVGEELIAIAECERKGHYFYIVNEEREKQRTEKNEDVGC
jgi:hypothetical protein